MMRTMMILGSILGLATLAAAQPAPAPPQETGASAIAAWRSELAERYGVDAWPGKGGPVVAGLRPELVADGAFGLVFDHARWIDVAGEKTALLREYRALDGTVTLDVAVTRTCDGAHAAFFDHLARPRSMMPLDPPALPYGCVRLAGIGDVAFALPAGDTPGYRAIEFVRSNLVILLRAEKDEGTEPLEGIARAIDRAIRERPTFDRWEASGAWPAIGRFAALSARVRTGAEVPIEIEVSDPHGEAITRTFDFEAGGIREEGGRVLYHAEASGQVTLELRIANASGLAESARLSIEVE